MNKTFLRTALMAGALTITAVAILSAETMLERSSEVRFQLDLKVPDAALAAFLPQGWTPNIATQGAAKDCNLRAVFIERVSINDSKGASAGKGSSSYVYLVAPVKNPAGDNVQMVIGGIAGDSADAPGPFGNYLLATKHSVQRTTTSVSKGATIDTQDWLFNGAGGERLEMHIKFERANAAVRPMADTKFYSSRIPSYYQISRQEQVLDILRNTTTNPPDRVQEFSFQCSGGSYAKLCDGTQTVLSWDNILWLNRTVLLP